MVKGEHKENVEVMMQKLPYPPYFFITTTIF
jgi:hypothetical protein